MLQDKLLSTLLLRLSRITTKAAIFSSVEPYAATFVPAETVVAFPPILTDLMDKNTFTLKFAELLKICEAVNYSVTEEGAKNVEAHTRQQAKSETWFRYQAGRITASKMKSVPLQLVLSNRCVTPICTNLALRLQDGAVIRKSVQGKPTRLICALNTPVS